MNKVMKKKYDNIRKYKKQHPNTSLRSMGKIFKLSHTMVAKILKESE